MLSPKTKERLAAPVYAPKPGKARERVSHPDFLPDQNAVRTHNDITTGAAFGMEFDTRIIKPRERPLGRGGIGARDVHHLNIADSVRLVNSMRAPR